MLALDLVAWFPTYSSSYWLRLLEVSGVLLPLAQDLVPCSNGPFSLVRSLHFENYLHFLRLLAMDRNAKDRWAQFPPFFLTHLGFGLPVQVSTVYQLVQW